MFHIINALLFVLYLEFKDKLELLKHLLVSRYRLVINLLTAPCLLKNSYF